MEVINLGEADGLLARVSVEDIDRALPPDTALSVLGGRASRGRTQSRDRATPEARGNHSTRRLVSPSLPHYPVTQLDEDLGADDLL